MVRRFGYLIFLPSLWAFPLELSGQDQPDMLHIAFRVFSSGKGKWDDIRVEAGPGSVTSLAFRKNRRSSLIPYRGPNPIIFFREYPSLARETPEVPVRKEVGRVIVPKGFRECLFFFVAIPATRGPDAVREFLVYVMDDSLESFPSDTMVVLNLTGATLVGRLGDESARFKLGPSVPYSLRKYSDEGIPTTIGVETIEGPKLVFQGQLKYSRHNRVILLLEPPRRAGSFRIVAKRIIQLIPNNLSDFDS